MVEFLLKITEFPDSFGCLEDDFHSGQRENFKLLNTEQDKTNSQKQKKEKNDTNVSRICLYMHRKK